MNICIVIDNIFPSHGGIGKTTERFAELLTKRGHKITFLSSTEKFNKERFKVTEGFNVHRLRGLRIPFTHGIYYQAIPNKKFIRSVLEKEEIDVILITSYTLMRIGVERVAKKMKIPTVLALHFQPENVTQHIHMDIAPLRGILGWCVKHMCDRSKDVIVPSKFAQDVAESYGAVANFNVVSNGIDLKTFDKLKVEKDYFRKKFKLGKKRYFLSVGRLMPEKNLGTLLESVSLIDYSKKENSDLITVIVGGGNSEKGLKKKAEKLGILDHVIFTGKVDDKSLKSAFKGCELFVLPSFVELEGIVVLEAMAMGSAVLVSSSKKSASPYLVKGNGKLFDPCDPQEMAEKMVSMVNDKKGLAKMKKTSDRLIKNYQIEKSVDKVEKILKKLAKK